MSNKNINFGNGSYTIDLKWNVKGCKIPQKNKAINLWNST